MRRGQAEARHRVAPAPPDRRAKIEAGAHLPGIVDSVARAFKVDMAAQYRIGWAAPGPGTSDIRIVCAGRPLLENGVCAAGSTGHRLPLRIGGDRCAADRAKQCHRRRRRGQWRRCDGTAGLRSGARRVRRGRVGQEHAMPEFLRRLGVGAPEPSRTSSALLLHDAAPGFAPGNGGRTGDGDLEDHLHAAQYRQLSHAPSPPHWWPGAIRRRVPPGEIPRSPTTPSPVIGENIDGLEPASPIYNFRYPNMRLRYGGPAARLLAVGDAYTSADGVGSVEPGAQKGSSGDTSAAG